MVLSEWSLHVHIVGENLQVAPATSWTLSCLLGVRQTQDVSHAYMLLDAGL